MDGGKIFRKHSDRPWGTDSLLYSGYLVFTGSKSTGAWRWPLTTSTVETKERVDLYLSPLRNFVACCKVNFTFTFYLYKCGWFCVCACVHLWLYAWMFANVLSASIFVLVNHLTTNGHYMRRTTRLTSRCCILYIYSTNIRTEYFKHAA